MGRPLKMQTQAQTELGVQPPAMTSKQMIDRVNDSIHGVKTIEPSVLSRTDEYGNNKNARVSSGWASDVSGVSPKQSWIDQAVADDKRKRGRGDMTSSQRQMLDAPVDSNRPNINYQALGQGRVPMGPRLEGDKPWLRREGPMPAPIIAPEPSAANSLPSPSTPAAVATIPPQKSSLQGYADRMATRSPRPIDARDEMPGDAYEASGVRVLPRTMRTPIPTAPAPSRPMSPTGVPLPQRIKYNRDTGLFNGYYDNPEEEVAMPGDARKPTGYYEKNPHAVDYNNYSRQRDAAMWERMMLLGTGSDKPEKNVNFTQSIYDLQLKHDRLEKLKRAAEDRAKQYSNEASMGGMPKGRNQYTPEQIRGN
jgi:hypothetical protein